MWIREREARGEDVRSIARPAEEARLRRWVEALAVPRHVRAEPRTNAQVRERLADAFADHHLSVRLQGPWSNVVALPPRVRGPLTLLTAHYDSVPGSPGADDNASGLAVMLECARLLEGRGASVGFVAFNAEEDGLLGSRDFVRDPGCDVATAHVLEMVGFRAARHAEALPLPWTPRVLEVPDFIGLLTHDRSNAIADLVTRSAASPALRVVTAKTWGPIHRLLPDLTRSDHFAFWEAELPSALWTDTGNFRNPHYHHSTDTPDTLDYGFMRDVADVVTMVLRTPHEGRRS